MVRIPEGFAKYYKLNRESTKIIKCRIEDLNDHEVKIMFDEI